MDNLGSRVIIRDRASYFEDALFSYIYNNYYNTDLRLLVTPFNNNKLKVII